MGLCHLCSLSVFARGIALLTLFACFVVTAVFLLRCSLRCVFVVGVCFCFVSFFVFVCLFVSLFVSLFVCCLFVLCVCVCLFVCLLCWFDGARCACVSMSERVCVWGLFFCRDCDVFVAGCVNARGSSKGLFFIVGFCLHLCCLLLFCFLCLASLHYPQSTIVMFHCRLCECARLE